MKIVFWLSLVSIFYTYVGYPILVWALSKILPRPWHSAPTQLSVSIVLAVHNGADLLPGKIRHLLELDYSNLREIIIVSDGSADATAELLSQIQHPLLKTIILTEHAGKAAAVNAGVTQASGEVILFVDIRPEIAPGAIQRLVNNFADPKVGCVAGELILRQQLADVAAGAVGGLYWRYEQWIRKCESAIDSPVGVYGGFYAVRRALVEIQPPGMILDDMFQPLAIVRKGYRCVLDSSANVYDTWPKTTGAEFHRKVRTLAGNFQLFRLAPWTLTLQNRVLFQLVSHKVLRLLAPYLMTILLLAAVILSPGSRFYAIFATVQVLSLALALLGLRFSIPGLRVLCAPTSALLVLNTAAAVGLYKYLFTRHPLWQIWTKSNRNPLPRCFHSTQGVVAPDTSTDVQNEPALQKESTCPAEARLS